MHKVTNQQTSRCGKFKAPLGPAGHAVCTQLAGKIFRSFDHFIWLPQFHTFSPYHWTILLTSENTFLTFDLITIKLLKHSSPFSTEPYKKLAYLFKKQYCCKHRPGIVDCKPGSEEPDSGQREVLAKDRRARDECDMQDYNLR